MIKSPLLLSLCQYLAQEKTGFHTPGHQGGKGSIRFLDMLSRHGMELDLTELPGLDNLKNPTGCLLEAQKLAAQLFGAHKTFFLVNGTTVGLQAALLALSRPGQKVLIPRNAHISVINGLVLSGAHPVVMPVEIEPEWGIPLGAHIQDAAFLEDIADSISMVLAVHPNYQGIVGDLTELQQFAGQRQIPLVVDEAHGAHLFFSEKPGLSAQRLLPDVTVQSTHKTLAALTQASMLHVNREEWVEPLTRTLEILQTTSPSYLLMASLDAVQADMAENGKERWALLEDKALTLRENIARIGGYKILGEALSPPWQVDPAKLAISAASLGLSGWELSKMLWKQFGIAAELCDYYYVLFLLNEGHDKKDLDQLLHALRSIASAMPRKKPLPILQGNQEIVKERVKLALSPRETYYRVKETLPLRDAAGRIAAEPVTVYPPGIPLIWPGEIISQRHLDYLEWMTSQNLPMQGIVNGGRIRVIKDCREG